jgi:AcrR family transcriptional regulator
MTEAVSRFGYPDASLDSVITLAGVSKTDFYGVFGSKAECFWATFEVLLEGFAGDVEARVSAAEGPRRQLEATVEALAQKIGEEPGAVGLVLVDSLALGPAGDDPRARSQLRFEELLRGAAERGGGQVSPATARGIVIGLRRLSYRALRDDSSAELAAAAPALAAWILAYAAPAPARDGASPAPAVTPAPPAAAASSEAARPTPPAASTPASAPSIPWDESPRSLDSRVELSARERIMRAVAQLVTESGYGKLTVPGVSTRAGISNQTFYAEFEDKEAALLASFDALAAPSLAATQAAFERPAGWRDQVASGLSALLEGLATQPLLAELAFRALPLSGRAGLDRIDVVMERLGAILAASSPAQASTAPALITNAVIGGAWGMIRTEALAGRRGELTALHRELVDFVTTGLDGS